MNTVPSVLNVNNQIGAAALIKLYLSKCGAYLTAAFDRVAVLNRSFTVLKLHVIMMKLAITSSARLYWS